MSDTIAGKKFHHLGFIGLELGADGHPIQDNPQKECAPKELHPKLEAPSCRLELPKLPRKPGVYIVEVGNERAYVGVAQDLAKRWNGYRTITPAKCKRNGQPTNCRVNHLILKAHQCGRRVGLLFRKYETLEKRAIDELHPSWNEQFGSRFQV